MSLTSLSEIGFSDLCVDESMSDHWFKTTSDSMNIVPLPAPYYEEAARLMAQLRTETERTGRPSFRINWQGMLLRVQRMQLPHGAVFICRRFRELSGDLASLGMPRPVITELLSPQLREGLVVLLGKAGAGKTTTACTMIRDRLSMFGGICWTIENPIELNIGTRVGKGACYQTEADSDESMAASISAMYRATPNIIFVGEARDARSVHEAIVASLSGHLVILTLHAGDIVAGLARLASFHGGPNAFRVLSDAIRMLVHLELRQQDMSEKTITAANPNAAPSRVLSVEPLIVNSESVQAMLRDGALHLLRNEIDRQRRLFMSQGGR